MKIKDVEKFLNEKRDKYISTYGLQHWTIEFDISDNDSDAYGECEPLPSYERATITLFAANLQDEAELHETICHEMEHILDCVFYIYQEAVNEVLPSNIRRVTDNLFMNCVELARSNIGRFRASFFSEPP